MFEITVSASFAASHSIREEDGSFEPLHGHNWRVDATARRAGLSTNGLAIDFRVFKRLLDEAVADVDHRHLNDLPAFASKNPTAEEVAALVFERLERAIDASGARLARVAVLEAEACIATFVRDL